jgi:hypothetical protein
VTIIDRLARWKVWRRMMFFEKLHGSCLANPAGPCRPWDDLRCASALRSCFGIFEAALGTKMPRHKRSGHLRSRILESVLPVIWGC